MVILGTGGTIAGTAGAPPTTSATAPRSSAWTTWWRPCRRWPAGRSRPSRWRSSTARTWTTRLGGAGATRARTTWRGPRSRGVVVTHGTDTLEETAYFLQRVLAPRQAGGADGGDAAGHRAAGRRAAEPARRRDAGARPGARGVLAVLAGRVHAAADLRKVHG